MDTTPTQPVAGHDCPNPEFHGNPYRYCSCGWQVPDWPAAEMLAEMRALEAANGQAEKTLAAEGVQLELVSLLRVRLEELVEHLLGPLEVDDRPNGSRVQFELRMQQRFARELAGVVGQVARAKLTAPGAIVPKSGSALIVPGR
jgi:hypothetical protein